MIAYEPATPKPVPTTKKNKNLLAGKLTFCILI